MDKKIYIYTLAPIDFWDAFKSLKSFLDDELSCCRESLIFLIQAMMDCENWEGDLRHGEVFVAPDLRGVDQGGCPETMFFWKQDNNGTTFLATRNPIHVDDKTLTVDEVETEEVYDFSIKSSSHRTATSIVDAFILKK